MRYVFRSCLLAGLAWSVFSWSQNRPLRHPPGVLVAAEPQQETCEPHTVGQFKNYTLTAVATYAIQARVLHTKHYWANGADLVPYDVALGWGRMSDEAVLDQLRISQSNRFFFYEWQDAPPLPEKEIVCHAANNHIIAANRDVAKAVRSLRSGQVVAMRGSLVNVTGPNDFHWNTSLTRNDSGNGACEVFYVESVQTLDAVTPVNPAPITGR
jgi:hypothetical protein